MVRVSPLILVASGLLFGLLFGLGACSSDEEHHGGRRSRQQPAPTCAAQTSCGSCTPILGCGWCQYEDGTGSCATGPDACRDLSFRWNWETVDCPAATTPSDAGFTPADAVPAADTGSEPLPVDSGAAETASAPDTGATDASCVVPAAASAACTPTSGGTLCPSGRYTLGCHASGGTVPTPDSALGCSKAYAAGAETYYCCPCGG